MKVLHFLLQTQHVNIILRGTIRYMIKCGKPADEFSGNFQFVLKRMLKSIPDVEELFLMVSHQIFIPITVDDRCIFNFKGIFLKYQIFIRITISDRHILKFKGTFVKHQIFILITVDDRCILKFKGIFFKYIFSLPQTTDVFQISKHLKIQNIYSQCCKQQMHS